MITPLPWLERVPTFKEHAAGDRRTRTSTPTASSATPSSRRPTSSSTRPTSSPSARTRPPTSSWPGRSSGASTGSSAPVFPEPQMLLTEVPQLAGTDGRKMSKSFGNAIYLKDTPEVIRQKIAAHGDRHAAEAADRSRASRTTARSSPCTGPSCPRTSRTSSPAAAGRRASAACECKKVVIDSLIRAPRPVPGEAGGFEKNPGRVWDILEEGNGKARADRPGDHGRRPGRARILDRARCVTRTPIERRPETPEGYQVRLEIFEGPLDLLLFLIRKKKIDIHDIPIAVITREYLDYLDRKERINLDREAEFLLDGRPPHLHQVPDAPAPREGPGRGRRPARGCWSTGSLEYQKIKAACSLLREKEDEQLQQLEARPSSRPCRRGGPGPDRGLALRPGRILLRPDEAEGRPRTSGSSRARTSRWTTR